MIETLLVVIGDTQIGSTTGLATPHFTIHKGKTQEEQTVTYNRLQEWLWACWTDFWDYVKVQAGVRGKHSKRRIITVHLGDVIEGNHHGSNQLMAHLPDQHAMALEILDPVRNLSSGFYGILGTDAHDGPNGDDAGMVYEMLGANAYDHHLTLDVDGIIHYFAHHGRVGGRDWTSQASALATEIIVDCATTGAVIPDFAWFGHNHVIDDSGRKNEKLRVICTPSWQLKTAFGSRVSAQKVRSDIGGMLVTGDYVDFSRSRYKAQPDGRRVIKV